MSHGYTNCNNSFINVPTIIVHEPAVFQSVHYCSNIPFADCRTIKPSCDAHHYTSVRQNPLLRLLINRSNNQKPLIMTMKNIGYRVASSEKHVTTICKSTNDNRGITFTTSPNIHSSGCLIQNTKAGILVQTPLIEIQRKLTGGGCLVRKKPNLPKNERLAIFNYMKNSAHQTLVTPSSSCLKLPGNREIFSFRTIRENGETMGTESRQQKIMVQTNCDCNNTTVQQNLCQCHRRLINVSHDYDSLLFNHANPVNSGMQIRVNAKIRLPVNFNDCRINIRATTAIPCGQILAMKPRARNKQERNEVIEWKETKEQKKQIKKKEKEKEKEISVDTTTTTTTTCYITDLLIPSNYANDNSSFIDMMPIITCKSAIFQSACCLNSQFADSKTVKFSNNFNKSTIMQSNNKLYCSTENRIIVTENSNSNNEPKDRTPIISQHPWSLNTKLLNKDIKLHEMRRLLQTCGWYHENISWKQSENLLKNTSIGRWLMRDSSDNRYIFAISVQTARGPTSVRVCHFLKHYQLDTEPGLTLAIPTFDCPITMLEHYVEYSKRMDRREVWVDFSGQLYTQIYLTKPLMKEVKSLSHLARLVVNKNKLLTKHLPLLIRNYLAEYPYTL